MLERYREKGTLLFCWWECKWIQSPGKVSSQASLLTSALLTPGWKLLVGEGAVLCIVGVWQHPWSLPKRCQHAPQRDNQHCLQTLPDVLQIQYHWFRVKTWRKSEKEPCRGLEGSRVRHWRQRGEKDWFSLLPSSQPTYIKQISSHVYLFLREFSLSFFK